MMRSSRWPVIFLLILIGASLRMLNLGKPCLWLDETITYDRALASVPEIIKASYGWDFHPPTYYVILHYMARFGHSPEVLRLFSVICGVLSILVFYYLGREILGHRDALVATLLLAVSVYQIRYAQEARMYILFFLVALLSLLFFYRAFAGQRQRDWFLWAGFSVIAFYVHYFALFLMAAQAAFYVAHLIRTKTYRRFFKQQRTFLLAALVLLLGCLPAAPLLIRQTAAKIGGYAVKQPAATPIDFLLIFLKCSFYPNTLANPLAERGLKYVFGAFIFLGALLAWKQRQDAVIFLGTFLGVALTLAWMASHLFFFSLTFRYLLFLNAPMMLLLAMATTTIADKIAAVETKKTVARAAVLGVICLMNSYILANYYQNPRNADWRTGFSYVKQNCRESDVIIPVPGYVTYIARYYLADDENYERVLWVHDVSTPMLETAVNQHRSVFFVLSDDMYPPEHRKIVDAWLAEHGKLLWEDPNFPGNVIWYSTKASSAGEYSN